MYSGTMKINQQLARYLEQILGKPVDLRPLPANRLSGLPVFLTSDYHFLEWRWLGELLILAQTESDKVGPSAADLKSVHHLLANQFKCPVVFVYPAMDAYRRNRFVQLGLPFVVPGLQLFIPPFISLCEQFMRIVKAVKLSAAAQVAVLYQVYRPQPDGTLLNQWAESLGYSAMTLTKVRDELVAHNLCMREEGAKPRGLRFLHQKRALWDAALPSLRSPAGRTHWVKFQKPPPALRLAGLSALSKHSLLEDDPLPTYACHVNAWKKLIALPSVTEVSHVEEASAHVECWRYDPGLLIGADMVDPLSLFLSLADFPDERVRLASKSLLEGMQW